MAAWLLLTFFIYLHNQLSSIHSLSRIRQYKCLKNVIHQVDPKLNGCSFQQVLEQNLGWFLTLENSFS